MKNITIITVLLLTGFLFTQATSDEKTSVTQNNEGIQFFHGTWSEALALAKKENKLVFMDAYATWCGPCKGMSKNVFTNQKVGTFFNTNFINVKMDMEKGEGRTLARKYNTRAYPTLYFMNSEGKVVVKEVGYLNNGQLLKAAEKALE